MTYADRRKDWIRGRRKKRNQARRARLNRQVFRYILLMAILWGGCSGLAALPWRVNDVNADVIVKGNSVVSAQQVRTAMTDLAGAKIFQLDPRKLEKKVETLKAVKYAFVRRYSVPHPTIVVQVLEEFPWASFSPSPDQPATAVISQSGRMISVKEFPRIPQPELMIYGPTNMKLNSKAVSQWAASIAYISQQTGQKVETVDMRKPYEVCVQDGDLYLKLGAADATLNRRLGRLSSILSSVEPLKSRLEYIDLGYDNNIPLKLAKKPLDGKHDNEISERFQATLPARGNI